MSKESIEKRARELFADQLRKESQFEYAHHVAVGGDVDLDGAALRAIVAALTPPEGYVLVPVEPTAEMMEAAGRVVFQEAGQEWSEPAGHAEGFVIETQRLCHAAMLAARPEAA